MDSEGLAENISRSLPPYKTQKNWALAIHGQAGADENGLPLMMNVPILGGFGHTGLGANMVVREVG